MGRRAIYFAVGLLASSFCAHFCPAATGPDFQDAVTALQRGDAPAAEQKLRAELKNSPDEPEALSLLGVALDNQKKFQEAGEAHQHAVARATGVPLIGILHNYGNHLMLAGDAKAARETFLKAVSLDASDLYADFQLAQLAVNAGNGQEALQYLNQIPANQSDAPNVAILRLAALDLADNSSDADILFHKLASATENDATLSASLAMSLVQARQFGQAETFLTHALAPDPTNFNLLYQLGVVASRAGHNDRAVEVLEKALRQQPQNVDVMYALAFVYRARKQPEQAVRTVAPATKLAPQRADVWQLLALAESDIRAYTDSVNAWEHYVALRPDDDQGRRERGFGKANIKQADAGMADLEWYVEHHPDDATGYYELGVAQAVDDQEKGLATLDKAVALEPDYVEARSARGALNYQLGKAEAARSDLEFAALKRPDSAMILDRLGQTYVLLDRQQDALRVLRRAAELAPGDAKMQLHFANALAQAGQTAESKVFMDRYRELGGAINVPARGVMDYLSLTPEEQHASYQARLEKAVTEHPEEVTNEMFYLKFLIGDNKIDQAVTTAKKVLALKPGPIIMADAGHTMLVARQYEIARNFLNQAGATAAVDLDLAIVAFHLDGAMAGLQRLDRIPETARNADYYAARAEMLDANGKSDDAITAMTKAVETEPDRVDIYWRAAILLIKDQHAAEARGLLDRASKTLRQEATLPVIRAVVEELDGNTADSLKVLDDARHRWPESAAVWAAQGMVFAAERKSDEARKSLEAAVSLGAHSAEVYYALAFTSDAAHMETAKTAIAQALKLEPDNAEIKSLAGRIVDGKAADSTNSLDATRLFLTKQPRDW